MFSLNSANKNIFLLKELEPVTSCVRAREATTVPARRM